MADIEHLIAFGIATLAFAILPGPALLFSITQTMLHGRRGGLFSALGLHVGGLVHVAAAAAGLSVVFSHVPVLFMIVKILGALYLVWLGIGVLRSGILRLEALGPAKEPMSGRRAFAQGITVEILNPKTAMFFIAFLPQFADPAAAWPLALQMFVLGMVVNIAFSTSDLVAVLLTSGIANALRRSALVQRAVNVSCGSVLIGLGLHLATSRN